MFTYKCRALGASFALLLASASAQAGGPLIPALMAEPPIDSVAGDIIEIHVPEADLARCIETLNAVFLTPAVEGATVSTPVGSAPAQPVVCVAQ